MMNITYTELYNVSEIHMTKYEVDPVVQNIRKYMDDKIIKYCEARMSILFYTPITDFITRQRGTFQQKNCKTY